MISHTPGLWTATWNEDGSWVGVDCGDATDPHCAEVCTVCLESIELDDEAQALERAKADARLIAAAPELLDALEALLCTISNYASPAQGVAYARACDAIAKAKGA